MNQHDTKEGWIMVSISSMACVFGASIVFIDKLLYKQHGSILSNNKFLASSMALASGVLLIASLASLLPESQRRLNSTSLAYFWFFCGTIITFLLTRIIHWCTPDAIHACGSDSPIQHDHHHHHHHHQHHNNNNNDNLINNTSSSASSSSSNSYNSSKPKNHHQSNNNNNDNDTSLITSQHNVNNNNNRQDETNENQILIHHQHHNHHSSSYGTTLPDAHFRFHEHTHHTMSHDHEEQHIHSDHHHHHQKDDHFHFDQKHQFLTIGIQTAIAICVHKFPEGLIMFISSQASSSLSVNVAAAMSIHNVTEGFMLVLPLYYATGSRVGAFLYAAIMGGLSQPLGALIGLLAFSSVNKDQVDALFGITFGIISGMMSFITIQSMLPQAIKFDDNHNRVVLFFFIGVFLIALSSALKSI